MSKKAEEEVDTCCASCGQAEVDVKLKGCACNLVKYCSDECQENHREQHNEECKKRLAEIRDRDLFDPPDISFMGECPICCLPLSLDPKKSAYMNCCSKTICNGCGHSNKKREAMEGLQQRCVFCREPLPTSHAEMNKHCMKRIKKNCHVAMTHTAKKRDEEGDYKSAIKYFTKAAELGNVSAHYNLSVAYWKGQGVEKSKEKEMYHLEQAAIGGHHMARHNLGCNEYDNGNFERARRHFIIAANLGYHDSLELIKELYIDGHASKEDYADALRAYQAAVGATKSAERDEAEEYQRMKEDPAFSLLRNLHQNVHH
jgi:tetratricopeptide (TPR) repeat protein